MGTAQFQRVRSNPLFKELCAERDRLAWILSAILLVIYFGWVLLVAFGQDFLAQSLWTGSVATIGFPIGVGVILSAIILTGIYVWRANTRFDDLTQKLLRESR